MSSPMGIEAPLKEAASSPMRQWLQQVGHAVHQVRLASRIKEDADLSFKRFYTSFLHQNLHVGFGTKCVGYDNPETARPVLSVLFDQRPTNHPNSQEKSQ
jgi:hypothetical protein